MRVNPAYSTTAANNPTGFPFADPAPQSFPKADPYCYRSGPVGALGVVPPPLCGTDWLPYARNFEEAATMTRAAFDRARVVLNAFAIDASSAWSRSEPQFLGYRTFLSVTDTSSAARYGLQTARLSRAGDNRPERTFVGPTEQGLRAGVESMKPREIATFGEAAVLEQPRRGVPAHDTHLRRGRPAGSRRGRPVGLRRFRRVRRHGRSDTRHRARQPPGRVPPAPRLRSPSRRSQLPTRS